MGFLIGEIGGFARISNKAIETIRGMGYPGREDENVLIKCSFAS